jgi:flavin-dependent dehydrogenase
MDWDVIVAGAGPAGSVAARTLAQAGLRVLLADPAAAAPLAGQRRIGETLPGAARSLLRELGLLVRVEGRHLRSPGAHFLWAAQQLDQMDAIRSPHGAGWHLDRVRFDADLRDAARNAGVACLAGAVSAPGRMPGGWRLRLAGAELCCRVLIDATGRRAQLARALGARRERDGDLIAVHAWYMGEGEADQRTLIEAEAAGWWYTARLPDQARVVALHLDAEDAATLLRQPGAWRNRLEGTQYIAPTLRGLSLEGPPRATDASGGQTLPAVGERWIAIGDAALSVDPLSSQGMLNALYTGWKGAQAIVQALAGDMSGLESYARTLDGVRNRYRQHRLYAYAEVNRFSEQAFWLHQRRWPVGTHIDHP